MRPAGPVLKSIHVHSYPFPADPFCLGPNIGRSAELLSDGDARHERTVVSEVNRDSSPSAITPAAAMEHRFRTHFSPPAAASGSHWAISAALGELQRRPASVAGEVRDASPGQCGASGGAACRIGLSLPVRPRKSTFLECSICGLIPRADDSTIQSLKAVLKESCARSSYCCFVDRRLTRPRGDVRDTSLPVTKADCVLDDTKYRAESSAQTLVARVYSSPVELSQACLLRSTTALQVNASVQSREARMAAFPGRGTSPEGKELHFSIHDSGSCDATGVAPRTAGRVDASEDGRAYWRRTTPKAAISRSMDVVLADEAVAGSSAMNFLQLVDVT